MIKASLSSLYTKSGLWLSLTLLMMIVLISCRPDTVEPQYEQLSVTIRGRILPTSQIELPVAVFIPGYNWISTDKEGYFSLEVIPDQIAHFPIELFVYLPPFSPVRFYEISKERITSDENETYHLGTISIDFEKEREEERAAKVVGKALLEEKDKHQGVLVLIEELGQTTSTRQDGEYIFMNIPAGEYTLHFFKESFHDYTLRNTRIPSADIHEIGSITMEEAPEEEYIPATRGTIEGRVRLVDTKGDPIREADGIKIRLLNTPFERTTDRLGVFQFDNIPYGNYFLEASFQGFETVSKSFYLNSALLSLPILRLKEYEAHHHGTVQGSLIYLDEKPDFTIVALKGSQAVGFVDNEGIYKLQNVLPGTYDLLIKADGFKPLTLPQIKVEPNVVTNIPAVNLQVVEDPPQIVTTMPADGQRNIRVDKTIDVFIVFSNKMDITPTKQAINVSPRVSHDLYMGREHSKSDWDTAFLVLNAGDVSNPVQFDKTYTVTINKNARDLNNRTLEDDYVFSFTTGRGRILHTTPRHKESNVSALAQNTIRVHFNCKINENSFKRAFDIQPAPSDNLVFHFYESSEGWTIAEVEVSLDYNTKYRVVLGNALRSWDRTSLENTPYTFEFQTHTPEDTFY